MIGRITTHKKLLEYLEKEFKSLFAYGISEVFEEVTADAFCHTALMDIIVNMYMKDM